MAKTIILTKAGVSHLLMVYIENTDYRLSKHDKAIEQIIIALNNLKVKTVPDIAACTVSKSREI